MWMGCIWLKTGYSDHLNRQVLGTWHRWMKAQNMKMPNFN